MNKKTEKKRKTQYKLSYKNKTVKHLCIQKNLINITLK
jgi:hypothetical protein